VISKHFDVMSPAFGFHQTVIHTIFYSHKYDLFTLYYYYVQLTHNYGHTKTLTKSFSSVNEKAAEYSVCRGEHCWQLLKSNNLYLD
jgi:hypothetical protein